MRECVCLIVSALPAITDRFAPGRAKPDAAGPHFGGEWGILTFGAK